MILMSHRNLLRLLVFFFILQGCSTDDPVDGGSTDRNANLKALGTSGSDLLDDLKFTSMRVEVAYVTGFEPSPATLSNLKSFLQQRTHKPDGITIFTRAVSSSGKAPFNINEIADIEKEVRTTYNTGDEIAVFIYFADGSNENDTNTKKVVGSAYRNTSMVIYGATVKNITTRTNGPTKVTVESTVINHEFGHLFGLVNLGTPLQSSHEDGVSKGHCDTDGCLMNANVQFGIDLIDMVDDNNIPHFDQKCLLDLQAIGGK